jgi:hypothetical protein
VTTSDISATPRSPWPPCVRPRPDGIVDAADGRCAGFGVKLVPSQVEEAATTLLRFAERVDTTKVDAPVVLGVIVGFGYGFVRPDGVAVIPIGSLAP